MSLSGIVFLLSLKKNMSDINTPKPNTGNASNPSPSSFPEPPREQLIDEKGEKYLKEVANIEDLPDAGDEQEMEEGEGKDHGKSV